MDLWNGAHPGRQSYLPNCILLGKNRGHPRIVIDFISDLKPNFFNSEVVSCNKLIVNIEAVITEVTIACE